MKKKNAKSIRQVEEEKKQQETKEKEKECGVTSNIFELDHQAICDHCDFPIFGVRYRCLNCEVFGHIHPNV